MITTIRKQLVRITAACMVIIVFYIICSLLMQIKPSNRVRQFTYSVLNSNQKIVKALIFKSSASSIVISNQSSDGQIEPSLHSMHKPAEPDSIGKSVRYVSMCESNLDYRRTGNQLFNFAAMLHVAHLTGRRVAMPRKHPHADWLDSVFNIPIARFDSVDHDLCPCSVVREKCELCYDKTLTLLSNRTDLGDRSLLICGWFQSWKYTIGVEAHLRRLLLPLADLSEAIASFLVSSRPARWHNEKSYVIVGIHIRADDVMTKDKFSFGYTVPRRPFFERAMSNITNDPTISNSNSGSRNDTRRIQFFVMSDSIDWVQTELDLIQIGSRLNSSTVDVEVTYSFNHTAGFDLILMTKCDVMIMTTGTFGWWGAWLANARRTIYYGNWPRPRSLLSIFLNRNDFFPPEWYMIDGPFYEF